MAGVQKTMIAIPNLSIISTYRTNIKVFPFNKIFGFVLLYKGSQSISFIRKISTVVGVKSV